MADPKNFWERVEDGWKEWYRQEGNVLRDIYKGSMVESFVESDSFLDFAGGMYSSIQGARQKSSAGASSMPKAGSRRSSAGKSVSPGTFTAGKASLGYTPRVDAAVAKISQSRSPSIQATYQRLQSQRSRGPLIGVEEPLIKVRRS